MENDLDIAIRNILQRTDLDPHGKVKLIPTSYRVFNYSKTGRLESGTLTLTYQNTMLMHLPLSAPVNPSSNNDYGADQIVTKS